MQAMYAKPDKILEVLVDDWRVSQARIVSTETWSQTRLAGVVESSKAVLTVWVNAGVADLEAQAYDVADLEIKNNYGVINGYELREDLPYAIVKLADEVLSGVRQVVPRGEVIEPEEAPS